MINRNVLHHELVKVVHFGFDSLFLVVNPDYMRTSSSDIVQQIHKLVNKYFKREVYLYANLRITRCVDKLTYGDTYIKIDVTTSNILIVRTVSVLHYMDAYGIKDIPSFDDECTLRLNFD
jgi:hypothetical protein